MPEKKIIQRLQKKEIQRCLKCHKYLYTAHTKIYVPLASEFSLFWFSPLEEFQEHFFVYYIVHMNIEDSFEGGFGGNQ